MSGEKNLQKLLDSMKPVLRDEEYIFTYVEGGKYGDKSDLSPLAMFLEDEAMTLVVPRASADKNGLSYDSVFKCITLSVHSSLDAVGLTASFSNKLAEHGISANVIAGYYHDHIFVQSECAERAMAALRELHRQQGAPTCLGGQVLHYNIFIIPA